jgi:hypothetical protein
MEYRILKTKYIPWKDEDHPSKKNSVIRQYNFSNYTKVIDDWLTDVGDNMYSYLNPLGNMDKVHIYKKVDTDVYRNNVTYLIYHSWVK